MNIRKKFNNKHLYIHLVIMLFVTASLIWLALKLLNIYTNHGKHFIVNDYSGLTYEEIISNSQNNNFNFIIIDSVYDNTKAKKTVINQSPIPGSEVKQERKIYLTIVSLQPEMVESPNLEDLTIRQVITVLKTYGLDVGGIEYVPDIGSTVITWKQYGRNISLGDMLIKGSRVDLIVGQGTDEDNYIPNLTGRKREDALFIIKREGFNIGQEHFPHNKDTSKLTVKKQFPEFDENKRIKPGSQIDIWYETSKTSKF